MKLLDLKVDRRSLWQVNITTAPGNIHATLAWCEKNQEDRKWYVNTMDGQPQLGPFDDEDVAIVAAFDYVQANRIFVTDRDGCIGTREVWLPDPASAPDEPKEPDAELTGPNMLRKAAKDSRTHLVSHTRNILELLADMWEGQVQRAEAKARLEQEEALVAQPARVIGNPEREAKLAQFAADPLHDYCWDVAYNGTQRRLIMEDKLLSGWDLVWECSSLTNAGTEFHFRRPNEKVAELKAALEEAKTLTDAAAKSRRIPAEMWNRTFGAENGESFTLAGTPEMAAAEAYMESVLGEKESCLGLWSHGKSARATFSAEGVSYTVDDKPATYAEWYAAYHAMPAVQLTAPSGAASGYEETWAGSSLEGFEPWVDQYRAAGWEFVSAVPHDHSPDRVRINFRRPVAVETPVG